MVEFSYEDITVNGQGLRIGGISGYCVPDIYLKEGEAIAREAASHGVSVVLGPGCNIKRNPLGGRNFEYISEDPYVAGKMAASFIKGAEGVGVGTSLKHFAVNSQEYKRKKTCT